MLLERGQQLTDKKEVLNNILLIAEGHLERNRQSSCHKQSLKKNKNP